MLKFEEAINKLDAKKTGKNYMALCPCHSDTDRSLSILKGDNNKAVFHCFAGCKHSEIYNFLNENNNYIPKKENINIPKNNINIPKKERVYSLEFLKNNSTSLYIYTDEKNKPVFLVRRYSTPQKTKNFSQYSFIDSASLKLGLNNNKTLLYNLPALIAGIKEGRCIFIVEGEKDVETLRKLNLIATSSPMGGGRSKWKDYYNQYFQDARVVIIPDNDLAGKEHAENIIKNLTGITKEIKLINLSDLKEKEDISDWIEAGHDKKELFEIINNTAQYQAEEEEKKSKITPVEPLPKNEKTYSIEEVREEIKKIIHSASSENILIKTLAGSGKTVTILKEINNITENTLTDRKKRYCYSSPFLKNIEELQKSGILDPSLWKIIKSRELKDDKNPSGNCYKKKEIDKLIERRINPTLRLCNHVDCPHYSECFSNKDMYLGQWQEKEKHIALSHKMLAMARGRLKDIYKIIIDENPLTSFLEKIDIVNTVKLEDKDRNKIDLAITEFERSYSLDDKKALPLFKAFKNMIKNLLISGRKEKKHICLTGNEFIEKFKDEYYKESYKELNSIFDIPDIRENDNYHFRQELHELIKEEITKYNNSNDNNKEYNSRIYLKYYKPVKKSPERIELYFRNKLELKQNYKSIIALDATTETLIWNKLLDEEFKEVKYNISLPSGYKHIQNISGNYGKNYHEQCMKSEDRKLIEKEIELFQLLGGAEKIALFGFKSVIKYIAEKLNLETEEIGSNFYGIKGSNHYQNYETALILGTSNMNINELHELTTTLFHDEEKINFTVKEEETRYNTNIENKDYTIKIKKAIDKRYDAMWQNFREGELTQVANRVRPLLSAKTIISMSNVPLHDLPPTELLTLNEMLSKFKKEKALKMAENNGKIEFSNITPAPQNNRKEEKESDSKGLTNSVNFEFNDLLKNNLWFCEKYKQILISLFQEKERLEKTLKNGVNSQCYQVTKVLYNIDRKELEKNYKNIFSLIALLLPDNTLDFTSFLLLSKDKMFYQRLYEKFCKIFNLKNQKNIISEGKGKMFYLNISFSPSFTSEELDINVIRAEYEKFNKYKEKGKVLDMIIPSFSSSSLSHLPEEQEEDQIEDAMNFAKKIIDSEPLHRLKTNRTVFYTSPHLPCLLNCDRCRNLRQCASDYEEELREDMELCLV